MKYIILCFLYFSLNSCSSHTNYSLVKKLNNHFKKKYSLEDGYLIALYDLAEINKDTKLYSVDYTTIINNNDYYDSFIVQCNDRINLNRLNEVSYNKTIKLKNLILDLNRRYSLLKLDENTLQKNNLHYRGEYFKELIYLDKLINTLPINLPMRKMNITSHYGLRNIGRKKIKFHHGIDLQGPHHCLIYSTGDGMVRNACKQNGYGNIVEIMHSNQLITKYAHLNKIMVKKGQYVRRGEIIGTQGKTGNARGEHLHHEILYCNKSVNPLIFIGHFFNQPCIKEPDHNKGLSCAPKIKYFNSKVKNNIKSKIFINNTKIVNKNISNINSASINKNLKIKNNKFKKSNMNNIKMKKFKTIKK